jgi:Na+-transporting methylmalonyl-CoA/oxaloacetate decarboxylase gamma subunit
MLVLALVVLALLAAFMVAALVSSGDAARIELFGAEITTTVAGVLMTGFVIGLLTLLMLVLGAVGARRSQVRRKRHREVAAERDALAAEKAQLEQQAHDNSAAPDESSTEPRGGVDESRGPQPG